MKSYQELKIWLEEKENKQKVVVGVCFILVFFVGFGAGRFERATRRDSNKTYSNYTTTPAKKPLTAEAGTQPTNATEQGTTAAAAAPIPPASGTCIVKGNISANSKIYHVKGGAFYDRVKPEQCFNTEAEALAAGFRKSSR